MELHSRVFKIVLVSGFGLFAMMGSQQESSASLYRYLCTSVPSACEYAPNTAPVLQVDVCWNGSAAFLKGANPCPTGHWPYHIERGEVVDPGTNEVHAYIPLDDGCDMGFCEVKPPDAGPTEPGAMCCGSNGCTPTTECGANDTLLYCLDGEEPSDQTGVWKCYETD